MCFFSYSSLVCISASANVYFKKTKIKPNTEKILTAGVPSSQALLGFLITAPPSVCVSAVLGALTVWIQKNKKRRAHQTHIEVASLVSLVCRLVLPCATVVMHARRVRHTLCPTILLPQCCLHLHCGCLPYLPLLLARPNQKLLGRSETSSRTEDRANNKPCGQGVSLFQARSRLVLHETPIFLYGGDLG